VYVPLVELEFDRCTARGIEARRRAIEWRADDGTSEEESVNPDEKKGISTIERTSDRGGRGSSLLWITGTLLTVRGKRALSDLIAILACRRISRLTPLSSADRTQ
jgi:hypothetical protein